MHLRRVPKPLTPLVAILSLTLLLGGILAPVASASVDSGWKDVFIETMINEWWSECAEKGGIPSVHYALDEGGHIEYASVDCMGAIYSAWYCSIDAEDLKWYCTDFGLTRPPASPRDTAASDGSIGGVLETDQAPLTDPIVENTDDGGQQVTDRPTDTSSSNESGETGEERPASTPVAEDGRREP